MNTILSNVIKAHASGLDQSAGQAKFGIVTSVNAANGTARVTIQPEGVLSGWLPVMSQWVGDGWGMICPPSPGDQVLLVPQEGDIEQGVIAGRVFSLKQAPPSAPSGEFWLVHRKGNSLKLCNDGTIRIAGDLHVTGDVYDRHGSVSGLRGHYNGHTHRVGSQQVTASPNLQD